MVTLSARLRKALHNYGDVVIDAANVGLRRDEERKLALVTARRQLSEQLGCLGPVIDQDHELARDAEKQRELSRLFAAMRYALAQHQADWPAVTIDDNPAAYLASSLGVKDKSDLFWEWCRVNLGFQRDHIDA